MILSGYGKRKWQLVQEEDGIFWTDCIVVQGLLLIVVSREPWKNAPDDPTPFVVRGVVLGLITVG